MVLSVENVSKQLSNRLVLNGVSFTVDKGEIVGFIGPNGAGKTTAIKVILGLLSPDTGSVKIDGHDIVRDHDAALSSVGAIIESPELYSYMSGYDNLMQFARIHGVSRERVMECARIVGLESRIKDKVSKYSLGMRQRLGVAQAIMHNPELLILDEPTNGLDPDGIMDLRSTLRRLASEGTAVLVSSHLLSELEHICTSAVVIENGVIISRRELSESSAEEMAVNMIVTVGNGETAANALYNAGYTVVSNVLTDGRSVITYLSMRNDVPRSVAVLASSGCDVYSLVEKKVTLEDAYLEATGNASVHGGDAK